MTRVIIYGPGGYDPNLPNNNVVEEFEDDTPQTTELQNEGTLQARLEASLTSLNSLANSSGVLTGLQLSNAVRLLARAVGAIIRLHLRRLDVTD